MRLTGHEKWVRLAKQGHEIYASCVGQWWPIVHIELDCGLVKIDVCGMVDIVDLDHCDIKIGWEGEVIEDVYKQELNERGGV